MEEGHKITDWPSIGSKRVATLIALILGAALAMLLFIRYIFL